MAVRPRLSRHAPAHSRKQPAWGMRSAEPGALGDAGGGGEHGRRDLAFTLGAHAPFGLFAAMLVAEPWLTMAAAMIAYLASIPFSVRAFRTLRRKAEALQRGAEGDAMGEAEGPPAD